MRSLLQRSLLVSSTAMYPQQQAISFAAFRCFSSSPPLLQNRGAAAAAMYKSSRTRATRGSSLPPSNKNHTNASAPAAAAAAASSTTAASSSSSSSRVLADADAVINGTTSASASVDTPQPSLSCADEKPAEQRPLTALQKRQLAMKDKKVFKLTTRAVDRVNLLLNLHNDRVVVGGSGDQQQRAVGIRVGVKKKGCSGYSYTVNYEFDAEKLKLKTGGDALVDAMINSTRLASAAAAAPAAAYTPVNSTAAGGVAKRSLSSASSSPFGAAAAASEPSDVHVDQDGVHIFVEGSALFYVIGTVMDYSVSNVEEKFTFQNPNQAHSCGCGESFMPFGV